VNTGEAGRDNAKDGLTSKFSHMIAAVLKPAPLTNDPQCFEATTLSINRTTIFARSCQSGVGFCDSLWTGLRLYIHLLRVGSCFCAKCAGQGGE
jgi:hypothetical protein